jgi:Trypsin-like peptidase domain
MLRYALIVLLASTTSVFANSAVEIAKEAFPSTVLVVIEDAHGEPVLLGSGFVLREHAIVTNMHVIEGASQGFAKQIDSDTKHKLEGILQADSSHDLAVLSVPSLSAPALPIGDSTKLAVGDTVYAVGNPRGLEGTFSQGIVSSIRHIDSQTLLQITAPISPGSSGGPILNELGEVVGVAVATFMDGQNLNFAIPASYLSSMEIAEKPLPFASASKKQGVAPAPTLPRSPSDFVEQFVADLATNVVDTQLRYYAERTTYYEFGRVDKATISRDLRDDTRAWPNRSYSIQGTPKITLTNNGFTTQFLMAYSLAGTKGVSRGVLDITLEAEFHGQTPQITQIHKKVISARRAR